MVYHHIHLLGTHTGIHLLGIRYTFIYQVYIYWVLGTVYHLLGIPRWWYTTSYTSQCSKLNRGSQQHGLTGWRSCSIAKGSRCSVSFGWLYNGKSHMARVKSNSQYPRQRMGDFWSRPLNLPCVLNGSTQTPIGEYLFLPLIHSASVPLHQPSFPEQPFNRFQTLAWVVESL